MKTIVELRRNKVEPNMGRCSEDTAPAHAAPAPPTEPPGRPSVVLRQFAMHILMPFYSVWLALCIVNEPAKSLQNLRHQGLNTGGVLLQFENEVNSSIVEELLPPDRPTNDQSLERVRRYGQIPP